MVRLTVALALLPLAAAAQVEGEAGRHSDATVRGSVVEPEPVAVPDDAGLAGLIAVPEGWAVSVAGRGLGNIRMLAAPGAPDGSLGALTEIVDDLPDGGRHPNRTLAMGPDGFLRVAVGSTCDACAETDDEHATVVRMNLDGTGRQIVAQGPRNTIGFGWEPATGALWGADMGTDWLGDDAQPEELNLIEQGALYGWPYVHAGGQVNPQDNPEDAGHGTLEEWLAKSTPPVPGHAAHASPLQMAWADDAFPEAYRGDAFVAMRGSWNRRPPSGSEVARVDLEGGRPVSWEPFATGFLLEYEGPRWGFLGRPTGLLALEDGSLLLGDDTGGILFRIAPAE